MAGEADLEGRSGLLDLFSLEGLRAGERDEAAAAGAPCLFFLRRSRRLKFLLCLLLGPALPAGAVGFGGEGARAAGGLGGVGERATIPRPIS